MSSRIVVIRPHLHHHLPAHLGGVREHVADGLNSLVSELQISEIQMKQGPVGLNKILNSAQVECKYGYITGVQGGCVQKRPQRQISRI